MAAQLAHGSGGNGGYSEYYTSCRPRRQYDFRRSSRTPFKLSNRPAN